jgi:AcrR family transcriptional regulator
VTLRTDAAAQSRRALLDAAAALLDAGGPAAVTLRAVGDRAGLSRGAPYGHFQGKAHLLAVLAAEQWHDVRDHLTGLADDPAQDAGSRLRAAVELIIRLGVGRPARYELMFTVPDEHDDLVAAAVAEAQEVFLRLVADADGGDDPRRVGALLMAGAHGIAGMSAHGHLRKEKWGVDAAGLVDDLLAATVRGPRARLRRTP